LTVAPRLKAQGDLAPPAPPGPTMKTLDEVEPRIPITSNTTPGDDDSQFRITQPGSYYLTGNVAGLSDKHGIEIAASDVTLDLMGYRMRGRTITIGGAGPSLSGIHVSANVTNLCIRDGTIMNWSLDGISGSLADHCVVENIRVSNCGGDGLRIGDGSVVRNCSSTGNDDVGIRAANRCRVSACVLSNNTGAGIFVPSPSTGCRIEENNVVGNFSGIVVESGRNLIVRKSASQNTFDFVLSSDSAFGPVVVAVSGGDLSGTPAASHPLANIRY
jgi:hypothetical protein